MPIRPERKHLYPANWATEIVPMIRARSGNCCEVCGVINGRIIRRSTCGTCYTYGEAPVQNGLVTLHSIHRPWTFDGIASTFEWRKPIRIILTVAHLNHDETDNRPENLAHLCQLHHNRHVAAITRWIEQQQPQAVAAGDWPS